MSFTSKIVNSINFCLKSREIIVFITGVLLLDKNIAIITKLFQAHKVRYSFVIYVYIYLNKSEIIIFI